jgi:hypothetical protein
MPAPAFLAPSLTAGLLALAGWSSASQEATIEDRLRAERIAALLGVIPERLGPWITTEVPIPTEAIEILRPNAIFCRRFMRIGGDEDLTVIVVHCGDARDMSGHYPPICYRQLGWTLDLGRISRPEVENAALSDPELSVYRFRRTGATGEREEMTVLNGFILPDGRTSADVFDRNPLSGPAPRASRGIAQVQFVFRSDIPDAAAVEIARDVLSELPREALRSLIGTPLGVSP